MTIYKSENNTNVSYTPLFVTRNVKLDAGVKMVIRKIIEIQKRFEILFGLISIPYKSKVKKILIYWKPRRGNHKGKWLLLDKNFVNYTKESSNIRITHVVRSKKFIELLDKMLKNEKSNPTKSQR